jgi:hypothetical protein
MDDEKMARLDHFLQNLPPESATKAAADSGINILYLVLRES